VPQVSARQPAREGEGRSPDWLERFEPLRPLASDRFTRRFLCRDTAGGGRAIVREVRPAAWWRAEERAVAIAVLGREAEMLTALAAGTAAGVFPSLAGAGLETGPAWIALEPVEGASLRDLFPAAAAGRIPDESGCTLVRTLEALLSLRPALLALAERGLAHGGLRPETLIVAPPGDGEAGGAQPARLRIADLGWAALPPEVRRLPDVAGLPYVSPAILGRSAPPGPDADTWSLAAILFECLAGVPAAGPPRSGPFDHEWRSAVRRAGLAGPPDRLPPRLPAEIAAFVRRGLEPRAAGPPAETGAARATAAFFAGLEDCLARARRHSSWGTARLPNPRLLAVPPAPALLARHDELWKTWRATTRRLLEAFHDLLDLAAAPPWSDWKAETERSGAACVGRHAADDPARADADLLPPALREIEARIARLEGIADEATALLEPALRDLAGRLDAAPVAAGEPAARARSFAADAGRLRDGSPAVERLALAARLRSAAPLLEEDLRAARRALEEERRADERRAGAAQARDRIAARIDRARRAAGTLAAAGERAAERAILSGAPDQETAGLFCRALERLERAVEAAHRRLQALGPDDAPDAGLTAGLDDLERLAIEARRAWWPAERLPLSRREWEAYERRVLALVRKGSGGIAKAEALLRAEPPAGWEDAARALLPAPAAAPAPAAPAPAAPAPAAAHTADAGAPAPALPAPAAAGPPGSVPEPAATHPVAGAATRRVPRAATRPARFPGLSPGRLRAAIVGGAAAVAAVAVVAWLALRPEGPGTTPGPTTPQGGAAVVSQAVPGPALSLSRAWISGPALPSLTARLEWEGGASEPVTLPGAVTFPDGRSVRVIVSWDGGTARRDEVPEATAATLQDRVSRLLRDVPPAVIEEALDREVAAMASGILEGRR
jgi:hypothetical protein